MKFRPGNIVINKRTGKTGVVLGYANGDYTIKYWPNNNIEFHKARQLESKY